MFRKFIIPACFIFLLGNSVHAATYTMQATGGNWDTNTVWTPSWTSRLPGDVAIVSLNSNATATLGTGTYTCDVQFSSGTISGSNITFSRTNFHQTGGTFRSTGTVTFGTGVGNVANYTLSGGTFDSKIFNLGMDRSTASLDISGSTVTFGASTLENVTLGGDGGNVVINMSGQSFVASKSNSYLGTATNYTTHAELNLDSGLMQFSGASLSIGHTPNTGSAGYAYATVNQTGGTMQGATIYIGVNRAETVYNLLGGTLTGTVLVGSGTSGGSAPSGTTYIGRGTLNISDTATANLAAMTVGRDYTGGTVNMDGGTLIVGSGGLTVGGGNNGSTRGTDYFNLYGGTVTVSGPAKVNYNAEFNQWDGIITFGTLDVASNGNGVYNIRGGDLTVTNKLSITSGNGWAGEFNIWGNRSTINVNSVGLTSNTYVNFFLESRVVTIFDSATNVALTGNSRIRPMYGFSSINQKTFNVVEGPSINGTFIIHPDDPFTRQIVTRPEGGQALQVTFDDTHRNMQHWDLLTDEYLFRENNYWGWIKLTKNNPGYSYEMHAEFVDQNNPGGSLGPGIAELLIEYLNDTMVESGSEFVYLGGNNFLFNGDFFEGMDFTYFGWDLNGFNEKYGTDISFKKLYLYEIITPEPETWGMLLAGAAGLGMVYRRRKFTAAGTGANAT